MPPLRGRAPLHPTALVGRNRHPRHRQVHALCPAGGTIPSAVVLDADIFAEVLISVVPPNQDYPAFWRSMMRLAHELAQNNVVVVYFSTMVPKQLLVNTDVLDYFDSVHFLCLTCSPDVLHARLARRDGSGAATARIQVWLDFNSALLAVASEIPTATVVDAGRTIDEVEHDVRNWINTQVRLTEV